MTEHHQSNNALKHYLGVAERINEIVHSPLVTHAELREALDLGQAETILLGKERRFEGREGDARLARRVIDSATRKAISAYTNNNNYNPLSRPKNL